MRAIFVLFLTFTLLLSKSYAQKNDYVWPMGSHGFSTVERILADTIDKFFWPFSLNFNAEPMKIDYFPTRRHMFDATNSNYCTDDGALFCYTNGMQVMGPNDMPINGGDTINYGRYWIERAYDGGENKVGFTLFQGAIFLPVKSEDSKELLYLFNSNLDYFPGVVNGIWFTILDTKWNNEKGCVIKKDIVLKKVNLKTNLQACRHANGRDWWLIAITEDNTTYHTFLLDPLGVREVHTQKLGKESPRLAVGTSAFSQQGDKFGAVDGAYWDSIGIVSIYDFDRCTGLLSNPFHDTLVIPEASVGQGAIFSPDGRYFYANQMHDLYQYDMKDLSKPRVHLAIYDGFQDPTDWPGLFTTQFGFWAPGPDGRLYNVSGAKSSRYMHVMDYPNEEGDACTFRQHAIRIPNNPWSIPNFPHYRLGPLDGSPCDTLGLDNHPIAKYRYEADSTDHLRLRFTDLSYFRPETWTWDFGDGSPRVSTQSPYHTFAQNGTYRVCLTVSNENSSNTSCRTITLGTSSSNDESISRADVSLFPNPVQDFLLITLGEYVPAFGQVMIYDVTGRPVITQRIYYGQNSVDMSALPAGMYVWKLMDGAYEVKEGKVVKM